MNSRIIKFPQLQPQRNSSMIVIENVAFAKRNKSFKENKKQRGFLTEHCLFFILHGKRRFHFGDDIVEVDENELIIVKRGVYTISEQLGIMGYFEALILFIPDQFSFPSGQLKKKRGINAGLAPYLVLRKTKMLREFETHYLTLFKHNPDRFKDLLIMKLREAFLLVLDKREADTQVFVESCFENHRGSIEAVVKENLFEPLGIQDYAHLSYRSVSTFKRDFERQFRMPPKQWINAQRLNHAKAILESSDQPVNEVAADCGFESVSHFIKIFKNQFGHTPRKYRTKKTII